MRAAREGQERVLDSATGWSVAYRAVGVKGAMKAADQVRRRPNAQRKPTLRRYGLDLTVCWAKAKRRMLEASGISPDQAKTEREPVARARRLAELAAPADMRLSLALGLGATAADLEADKAGARLMLEAAHKRLGIVGLRTGEGLEEGMSDRMTRFLAVWMEAAPSSATPAPRAPALGPARPGTETGPNPAADVSLMGCPSP